jgi:hypothetical protein
MQNISTLSFSSWVKDDFKCGQNWAEARDSFFEKAISIEEF